MKIDIEQIKGVLTQEVLKREVLEGEKAEESRRKINRLAAKAARAKEAPEDTRAPEIHPALQVPAAGSIPVVAAVAQTTPPPLNN